MSEMSVLVGGGLGLAGRGEKNTTRLSLTEAPQVTYS